MKTTLSEMGREGGVLVFSWLGSGNFNKREEALVTAAWRLIESYPLEFTYQTCLVVDKCEHRWICIQSEIIKRFPLKIDLNLELEIHCFSSKPSGNLLEERLIKKLREVNLACDLISAIQYTTMEGVKHSFLCLHHRSISFTVLTPLNRLPVDFYVKVYVINLSYGLVGLTQTSVLVYLICSL